MSETPRFSPRNVVEDAVIDLVSRAINYVIPVYESDRDTSKEARPWIVVKAATCDEALPMSGIFDSLVEIRYSSHITTDSSSGRDDIQKMIVELPYQAGSSIQERLSERNNFHCYGWQDRGTEMEVGADRKCYDIIISWMVTFIPRNNS